LLPSRAAEHLTADLIRRRIMTRDEHTNKPGTYDEANPSHHFPARQARRHAAGKVVESVRPGEATWRLSHRAP